MKTLAAGMMVALVLAGCSDSSGGGTGGGGGIQEPEDTSSATGTGGDATTTPSSAGTNTGTGTSTGTGTGSGSTSTGVYADCDFPADSEAICDALAACESGEGEGCLEELKEERCTVVACFSAHDEWSTCVGDVIAAGSWDQCPDYPDACDAQRAAYEDCVGTTCDEGAHIPSICLAAEDCEPGSFDDCIDDFETARCSAPSGECRDLFDAFLICFDDVVQTGDWADCPDFPAACDAELDAYEAACQ